MELRKQIAQQLVEKKPELLTLENLDKLIEEIEMIRGDCPQIDFIERKLQLRKLTELTELGKLEDDFPSYTSLTS
jgi:hypothetical protein